MTFSLFLLYNKYSECVQFKKPLGFSSQLPLTRPLSSPVPGKPAAGAQARRGPPRASAHKAKVCLSPSTLSDMEPEPSLPGCCQSSLLPAKKPRLEKERYQISGCRRDRRSPRLTLFSYRKHRHCWQSLLHPEYSLGPFFLASCHLCSFFPFAPVAIFPLVYLCFPG